MPGDREKMSCSNGEIQLGRGGAHPPPATMQLLCTYHIATLPLLAFRPLGTLGIEKGGGLEEREASLRARWQESRAAPHLQGAVGGGPHTVGALRREGTGFRGKKVLA